MLGAGEGGELALEQPDLGPHHVLPVREHTRDGGVDLRFQARLLGGQVDEGNRDTRRCATK